MTQHVSYTARTCFFYPCRIKQVRRFLNETYCRILVQALIITRFNCCHSVLSGMPSSTLQPVSSVLHTSVRLIKDLSPRDHIVPTLKQHPRPYHVHIFILMHHIHSGTVSRQLVYGHFVYDTSSTDISSTDISSTMTFLAEIEAGVMKRILCQ